MKGFRSETQKSRIDNRSRKAAVRIVNMTRLSSCGNHSSANTNTSKILLSLVLKLQANNKILNRSMCV